MSKFAYYIIFSLALLPIGLHADEVMAATTESVKAADQEVSEAREVENEKQVDKKAAKKDVDTMVNHEAKEMEDGDKDNDGGHHHKHKQKGRRMGDRMNDDHRGHGRDSSHSGDSDSKRGDSSGSGHSGRDGGGSGSRTGSDSGSGSGH